MNRPKEVWGDTDQEFIEKFDCGNGAGVMAQPREILQFFKNKYKDWKEKIARAAIKQDTDRYPRIVVAGVVVQEGEKRTIKLNAPKMVQWFLFEKCKVGDDISMLIKAKRPTRTEQQNNYFHLYLSLISLSSGHTMKELKNWYKGRFLSEGITEVFGDKTRIVKSSADLNISEFAELMNRIEETVKIPLPDPAPFKLPLFLDEYKKLKVKQTEAYSKMTPENL